MKSKKSRQVLKGEIKKERKKKEGNRMGGIWVVLVSVKQSSCLAKARKHCGGLGSLPSHARDFLMP